MKRGWEFGCWRWYAEDWWGVVEVKGVVEDGVGGVGIGGVGGWEVEDELGLGWWKYGGRLWA